MNTTAPVGLVATLFANHPDLSDAAQRCGRMLGSRAEVDLTLLERIDAAAAAAVRQYQQACDALWASVAAGKPAGAWVRTSRELIDAVQYNTKSRKHDLGAEFEALSAVTGVGDLLHGLTDPCPDNPACSGLADAIGATLRHDEDGVWHVRVELGVGQVLPDALGGVPYPAEVGRTVLFDVRHATWRDRRIRRLVRVAVTIDELWADPGPYEDVFETPAGLSR